MIKIEAAVRLNAGEIRKSDKAEIKRVQGWLDEVLAKEDSLKPQDIAKVMKKVNDLGAILRSIL